jgi:DNA-binding GntR family transcriptional regulator
MDAIERADLADQVYQRLRDDILRGRFANDERLHVGRLAERFGVSPTPVKTAIARLATEGLVAQGNRGGTFVTSLTESDIDELAEVRAMIEQYAAGRAIDLATDADIEHLDALAQSLLTRIHGDGVVDYDAFAEDDMAFHAALIGIAGNHHLSRLYASLHVYSVVRRAHFIEHGLGYPAQQPLTPYVHVHDEHVAIVNALRARDPAALRAAIATHLDLVRDFAKRILTHASALDPSST